MTPEYLNELADIADPDQLWRIDPFAQLALPPAKRAQLDSGVALRRYASVIRDMERAHEKNQSLVLTRLGPSVTDRAFIPMTKRHLESVERHRARGVPAFRQLLDILRDPNAP